MRVFYNFDNTEEPCYFTFKTVNFTSLEEDKSMAVINAFVDTQTFMCVCSLHVVCVCVCVSVCLCVCLCVCVSVCSFLQSL